MMTTPIVSTPRFIRASLLAVALCLMPVFGSSVAEAQSCLSASQTRSVIASGAVVRLASIRAAAAANGYPQIASASLCGSAGSYVYSVVATSNTGASARLTFNARSGALMRIN